MEFILNLDLDQLKIYSHYFRNLEKYGGPAWSDNICLPAILSMEEYKIMFSMLSTQDNYERLLHGLLAFFDTKPIRPLIDFVLYFLDDRFIPDLLRTEIAYDAWSSDELIAETLNAVGCRSQYLWPNSTGESLPLSEFVINELSLHLAVHEKPMLAASTIRCNGEEMISVDLLRIYIHDGIRRRRIQNLKEIQECCFCHEEQLALRVEGWILTGGLRRMPCCASPVHFGCFWLMVDDFSCCIKCHTMLEPDTGLVDSGKSNMWHTLHRMQIRDSHGVSRGQEIPPPIPLLEKIPKN